MFVQQRHAKGIPRNDNTDAQLINPFAYVALDKANSATAARYGRARRHAALTSLTSKCFAALGFRAVGPKVGRSKVGPHRAYRS